MVGTFGVRGPEFVIGDCLCRWSRPSSCTLVSDPLLYPWNPRVTGNEEGCHGRRDEGPSRRRQRAAVTEGGVQISDGKVAVLDLTSLAVQVNDCLSFPSQGSLEGIPSLAENYLEEGTRWIKNITS